MNEQERTEIILRDPEKDYEELMTEKLAEFPYLSEEGQEEKRMQLKLLLKQGASPALFASLFFDPDELSADEIDVIRACIRVTDENFYYDLIRNYKQDISEVLEKTKLRVITAGLSSGKKDDEDLFLNKVYGVPYLIVSSPSVISEISVEVRKHYEDLLEKIRAEIVKRFTNSANDLANSYEEMRCEEIRRLLEGLEEKEKQIQNLKEILRDHHIDYESNEKAALEEGEGRGNGSNKDHVNGTGNARAPNTKGSLIGSLFSRRGGPLLSEEARQVMDEYHKKKKQSESI